MSNIDSSVARVLDKNHNSDSEDEDDLIASLEESDEVSAFREQRLQQLHSEFTRAKQQKAQGYGIYTHIKEEKEVMDITTEVERSVVHFYKDGFARCGIMDGHIQTLATKHTDTRFLKISVEDAPFLVTKLKIQVLPCVIAFIKGKSVDRIIGFEGLSYTPDSFTTKDLEARLLGSGVLLRAKSGLADGGSTSAQNGGAIKFGVKKDRNDDDDDDEWD